eukprot:12534742-Ditylum_brightwellii.AAC.1
MEAGMADNTCFHLPNSLNCNSKRKGIFLLPDYKFDLIQEDRTADGKCGYVSKVFMSRNDHVDLAERLGGRLDDNDTRGGHFKDAKYLFECKTTLLPTHNDIRVYSQNIYFVNEEMNTWYQHHRIANDWGGDLASVHSEEEKKFISQISGH